MEFRSTKAGTINAIRYYKAPNETGTHVGRIWSGSGQLLASITFTNETASGWQQQALATPLPIQANTTYVVSVNANEYYAVTTNGIATTITNTGLSAVADGSNGVFDETPGAFPTQSWNNSNYFRDVVFTPNAPINNTPGTIGLTGTASQNQVLTANVTDADGLNGVTIAYQWQQSSDGTTWTNIAGATGQTLTLAQAQVANQVRVTANYTDALGSSENLNSIATVAVANVNDPGAVAITGIATQGNTLTATVTDADGVPTTIAYQWQQSSNGTTWTNISGATAQTLSLNSGLVGQQVRVNAIYTDVLGGSENIFSNPTNLITVAPQTLFAPTATPSLTNAWDGPGSAGDYELGMEFRSAKAGQINAIRYYKAPSETGPHVGKIWSSTGQLLASVTFTNETTSGWQEQMLPTLLPIAARTTYVVSVNANSYYAATPNGLATTLTHGVLSAVADGSNGVFNSNPGVFPSQSYNNTNYFRDVVFTAATLDTAAPTATLTASDLTKAPNSPESYAFAVNYNDDVVVDVSSLDSSDFLVTSPNGFNQLATLVSIYPAADGSNLTAFYKFAPPGNSWDANEAGTYSVNLQSNQVRDISGNAMLAGSLGTFQIKVADFSQNIIFPTDARIRNVKTEFGAKGDGITDDTQAIQNAFQSTQGTNQTVYFPAGTYLVSNPVWFRSWMTVQGEDSERTIIKLKDNASGYQDPNNPNWLMATTEPASPIGRSGDNMAFSAFVKDLTLDTGRGNPGAIALQFISHNGGGLEDVTIRSGDGTGPIGLDLRTPWNGPSLFKDVQIDGFDYGIVSWNETYFSTFEFISLTNQRVAGWENWNHPLVVRKLTSTQQNGVPAIINAADSGHFVILDSELNGVGSNTAAIRNDKGELFARNVSTTGYQSAIQNYGVVIPSTTVNEYVSGQVYTQFPSPPTTLNLPIKDTPPMVWEPLENWVSVEQFADKVTNGDWAPAIQAAIDSGKSTVYFPQGVYPIRSTIIVRGNVKVIQGIGSELIADGYAYNGNPMFRVETTTSPEIWIDRLAFSSQGPAPFAIEHASPQTLVALNSRYMSYRNTPGVGELFVENMPASPWYFQYPQKVWIRGLNVETGDQTKVINEASDLWVIGWKSEGRATELDSGPLARTEILGGNFYPASGDPEQYPTFINRGGRLSAVHAMFWANHTYIRDTWQGQQKILRLDPGTRFMPLYVTNP
jgi:hypothetical protein